MKRFLLMLLVLCLLTPSALAAGKGYTVRNGDRDTPSVALTIDDCINMDQVQRAVELCRQYNVQVTFFVVGKSLRIQDRQLWQDALDAGTEEVVLLVPFARYALTDRLRRLGSVLSQDHTADGVVKRSFFSRRESQSGAFATNRRSAVAPCPVMPLTNSTCAVVFTCRTWNAKTSRSA